MSNEPPNRYAADWNRYSEYWDAHYASRFGHLGDEWHDRDFEDRFFALFVSRFIDASTTVLEIGPGGGKWTARYAPLARRVIVLDVSEHMLDRTRRRCEEAGLGNVEYLLGNGRDLGLVGDASIDFVFSFDVLVHVALEDTWPYAREIARVMRTGATAVLHHAVNTAPDAWEKIAKENEWYRGGNHTLGQFYYHSGSSLRRMYERVGLHVAEQYERFEHCVNVVHKPSALVPTLERCLAEVIERDADTAQSRASIAATLSDLPRQLTEELAPLVARLADATDAGQRAEIARAIRRLWRGI